MSEIHTVLNQADSLIKGIRGSLNLSANENLMSLSAQRYLASAYSDRYYFESNTAGYADFPEFIAAGAPLFDDLLNDAKRVMRNIFDAEYVNLYPLSGIHAMLMVMLTLTEKDDVIASLSPQMHGHFATANVVNRIGRKQLDMPLLGEGIDAASLGEFVISNGVKLIYLDVMSAQHALDVSAIREAVGDNVTIVYDVSHTLGLIAGKVLSNPLLHGADVICGNTHKTFPGPHRGIILTKNDSLGRLIDERGSNLYSSVQANSLLALIITIHEMSLYGVEYAKKVVQNAQILQKALLDNEVIRSDIGTTENHQVHIVKASRHEAKKLLNSLRNQGIISHLCYSADEGYFVRIGTQEITRRGMGPNEMHKIARLIKSVDDGTDVRGRIMALNARFSNIEYSFDQ